MPDETQDAQNAKLSVPKKRRQRLQISCTECRKRKQKCVPRKDGPCEHCLRRYPPVVCVVQQNFGEKKTLELGRESSVSTEGYGELILVDDSEASTPGGISIDSNVGVDCIDPVLLARTPSAVPVIFENGVMNQNGLLKIKLCSDGTPEPGSDLTQQAATSSDFDIFYTRTGPITYEYRAREYIPSPKPLGGILAAVNGGLTSVPIENTSRNTELFHFFHQFVVPGMCSIDGKNTPQMFLSKILPWMLESHIMPHIGLLMASASQSVERLDATPKKSVETLAIKSRVLGLFNKFLEEDFKVVGNAAIRAIFPLVMTELFWGSFQNLWAHMRGMKQMIGLQGGLAALTDPVLQSALTVTDFQLACCCEQGVYLQTEQEATNLRVPIAPTYEAILQTPLLEYPKTFSADAEILGLGPLAADILDDIRFLTLSIIASSEKRDKAVDTAKIKSTAAWLKTKLDSLSLPPLTPTSTATSILTAAIHLSALVYSSSISTASQLSGIFTPELYDRLHTLLDSVPLARWKQLPGVFYWILLVACPACQSDKRAMALRRKMVVAGMAISLENFPMGIEVSRRFWCVQQWIVAQVRK